MTLVREIADAVRMLGDVVNNTRAIAQAVNDGSKFLASKHPDAQQDFIELLAQMQRTVEGLAEVTKIISGFRFVSRGRAVDREPVRFNDYVIAQKAKIAELKGNIRQLKGDCEKVRVLRDSLDNRGRSRSWGSMFGLVGVKARRRSTELASSLSNFYADDQRMIEVIQQMLKLAQKAIKDIEDALGPPGMASPYNVESATSVLRTYAQLFEQPQSELDDLADTLSEAATALRTG